MARCTDDGLAGQRSVASKATAAIMISKSFLSLIVVLRVVSRTMDLGLFNCTSFGSSFSTIWRSSKHQAVVTGHLWKSLYILKYLHFASACVFERQHQASAQSAEQSLTSHLPEKANASVWACHHASTYAITSTQVWSDRAL